MNIHYRCSEKVTPKNMLNSGIAYNIQPFYCKESTDFLPLCFLMEINECDEYYLVLNI